MTPPTFSWPGFPCVQRPKFAPKWVGGGPSGPIPHLRELIKPQGAFFARQLLKAAPITPEGPFFRFWAREIIGAQKKSARNDPNDDLFFHGSGYGPEGHPSPFWAIRRLAITPQIRSEGLFDASFAPKTPSRLVHVRVDSCHSAWIARSLCDIFHEKASGAQPCSRWPTCPKPGHIVSKSSISRCPIPSGAHVARNPINPKSPKPLFYENKKM